MKTVAELKQLLTASEQMNAQQQQEVKGGQCDKRRRVVVAQGNYGCNIVVP